MFAMKIRSIFDKFIPFKKGNKEKINTSISVTLPPQPPRYINFFEPFHFLAGDQLVLPVGASHISLPLQEIQSREEEKKEQTNNMLGLIQAQEGSYATLHFLCAYVD